jgi:hypothetical protein
MFGGDGYRRVMGFGGDHPQLGLGQSPKVLASQSILFYAVKYNMLYFTWKWQPKKPILIKV